MAITKLMHMKESPEIPHQHLKNAIEYVLDISNNQAKTNGGALVGGNAGTKADEILETFLDTKRFFGKLSGRQGYHFVISFGKGETDVDTAYAVTQQFCEKYLGDAYDYVFAVHTDKDHLHAHIIFNSVSRLDGYKYHYKKGDWKKYIQPVTDQICKEHGLAPLQFKEERVGVSYASWAEKQEGRMNWSHIIRADVDFAIQQSNSFEEFLTTMKKMDYQLRFGRSKKHGNYVTYRFVGKDGKEHKRRSYNLPPGYGPEEIIQRIKMKGELKSYEEVIENVQAKAEGSLTRFASIRSTQTFKRLYQAVNYYKLPNPYAVPAYQVRKDMLRIDRLLEECRFLKEHKITDRAGIEKAGSHIDREINMLIRERKSLYGILDEADKDQKEMMEAYGDLQKALNEALQNRNDHFEEIEDKMQEMAAMLPYEMLEAKDRLEDCNRKIKGLRQEKRILERIQKTETAEKQQIMDLTIKK